MVEAEEQNDSTVTVVEAEGQNDSSVTVVEAEEQNDSSVSVRGRRTDQSTDGLGQKLHQRLVLSLCSLLLLTALNKRQIQQ